MLRGLALDVRFDKDGDKRLMESSSISQNELSHRKRKSL